MKARDLALELNGKLFGDDIELNHLCKLTRAKRGELSFLLWQKDIRIAKKTQSCLITTFDLAASYLDELNTSVIAIEDVPGTFEILKNLQKQGHFNKLLPDKIIHESAKIHKTAHIEKAIIGPNVKIGPYTVVGHEAFAPYGFDQIENLASLGHVVIEENTSIGALCSIDRGLIGETYIGKNCLLDNQIHVGHDVYIDSGAVIAAQTGISGFVDIGKNVTIGGQVGIAPHINIGDGARITAKSGVHKNVKDYEISSGYPNMPHRKFLKSQGFLKLNSK